MARPFPADNPYLHGGFEPIRMECDNADLLVHGDILADLNGTLYRIGPNPQFAPRGRYNPLQADGMMHAFYITNGRVAYRNRWIRTQQWTLERAAGRSLFGTSGDPRDVDPEVAGDLHQARAAPGVVRDAAARRWDATRAESPEARPIRLWLSRDLAGRR